MPDYFGNMTEAEQLAADTAAERACACNGGHDQYCDACAPSSTEAPA